MYPFDTLSPPKKALHKKKKETARKIKGGAGTTQKRLLERREFDTHSYHQESLLDNG